MQQERRQPIVRLLPAPRIPPSATQLTPSTPAPNERLPLEAVRPPKALTLQQLERRFRPPRRPETSPPRIVEPTSPTPPACTDRTLGRQEQAEGSNRAIGDKGNGWHGTPVGRARAFDDRPIRLQKLWN